MPVCRFELTDFIENLVVYDGHRLRFFSFRLWFHPVGGYQTCLIISADFRAHYFLLSCISYNKGHVSAWVWCDQNDFKVWYCEIFSRLVDSFSSVTITKLVSVYDAWYFKICSVFKSHVVYSSLNIHHRPWQHTITVTKLCHKIGATFMFLILLHKLTLVFHTSTAAVPQLAIVVQITTTY